MEAMPPLTSVISNLYSSIVFAKLWSLINSLSRDMGTQSKATDKQQFLNCPLLNCSNSTCMLLTSMNYEVKCVSSISEDFNFMPTMSHLF